MRVPRGHPSGLTIELCVKDAFGRVITTLSLRADDPGGTFASMGPRLATGDLQEAPIPISEPVAGRIDASDDHLSKLIEQWHAHILAFGGKRKSADSYRGAVLAAARACHWSTPTDLTAAAIEDYIATKTASGEWKGTTVNRNVCAFRSFGKWLAKRGFQERAELEDLPRHKDDGSQGMRVATREEAIAHLEVAAGRERGTNYVSANRALQVLMKFQAGLRDGEGAQLVWSRHVHLDERVPFIRWTKDISKNRRDQDVALHPELAALLRIHRQDMRELAKSQPLVLVRNRRRGNAGPAKERVVSPDDPAGVVFPWVSSCFEADAKRAGIQRVDGLGRPYAPHSARKYFETALVSAGVHARMVDWLMRHRGGVAMRYFEPSLDDQLAAVSRLAHIAPKVMHNPRFSGSEALTRRLPDGHHVPSEDVQRHCNIPVSPAPPDGRASSQVLASDGAGLTEFLQSARPGRPGATESRDTLNLGMPRGGLEPPTSGL